MENTTIEKKCLLDSNNPKIYVACLASYNSGILHGTWIDASQGYDEVMEEIKAMLKESTVFNAEEFAIHDYDGFYRHKIDEYDDIEEICKIANIFTSENNYSAELISEIIDYGYCDYENVIEWMDDHYIREFKDVGEYACDMFYECYNTKDLPDFIRHHIDWDGIGRDMEINGELISIEIDGNVCLFKND